MTTKQVQWAQTHGWCVRTFWPNRLDPNSGAVMVTDYDEAGFYMPRIFADFASLQSWASRRAAA